MRFPFRKRRPPQSHAGDYEENFLFVTLDSCRFDTYQEASTPCLDTHLALRQAWSQATFTYASHMGMFQGMLPHVFAEENYYNRYIKPLWRIPHPRRPVEGHIVFPAGSKSIIDGFNKLGYYTCGTGAMAWFRNNYQLREYWQDFEWHGIHAREQIAWTVERLRRRSQKPFFAFINFGETHSPYTFDGQGGSEGTSLARATTYTKNDGTFQEHHWRRQVACMEFLDTRLGELFSSLQKSESEVTVVICGDHGECFGEEGLFGHGFYHPKVMEVPFGIFKLQGTSPT